MSLTPEHHPTLSITLRNGSVAEIRPILPDDRPLLVEGLRHMSIESRFARFGTGVASLTDSELDYLTVVDQVNHVAWGATVEGAPAGVGRYIRLPGQDCAEVAVTVIDEHQGLGLGRLLFDAIVASARDNRIPEVCFAVQPFNRAVREILGDADLELDDIDGLVEARVLVSSIPASARDADFAALLADYRE
jgi:GNAT superfamily N-acetyltransferase